MITAASPHGSRSVAKNQHHPPDADFPGGFRVTPGELPVSSGCVSRPMGSVSAQWVACHVRCVACQPGGLRVTPWGFRVSPVGCASRAVRCESAQWVARQGDFVPDPEARFRSPTLSTAACVRRPRLDGAGGNCPHGPQLVPAARIQVPPHETEAPTAANAAVTIREETPC